MFKKHDPVDLPAAVLPVRGNKDSLRSNIWNIANLKFSKLSDYLGYTNDGYYPLFIRQSTRDLIRVYREVYNEFLVTLKSKKEMEQKEKEDEEESKKEYEPSLSSKRRKTTKQLKVAKATVYLNLYGNAGTGKSTTVWAMFCNHAGNKIFVTNLTGVKGIYHVLVMTGESTSESTVSFADLRSVLDGFKATKDCDSPSLVVFDGAYENNPVNEFCEIIYSKNWFVVKCASGGPSSKVNIGTGSVLSSRPFCASGFTMEEYKMTIIVLQQYHPWMAGISEDGLKEIYNIIGGNARLFFRNETNLEAMRNCINDIVAGVDNKSDLIKGDIGVHSNSAVNNLMSFNTIDPTYVRPRVTIISRYAAELLLVHCELQHIIMARNIMPNKSYLGWLREAEMFARLRLSIKGVQAFQLFDINGDKAMDIKVVDDVVFDTLNKVVPYEYSDEALWTLYQPGECCHEGYDAMLVYTHGHNVRVLILQCTVASKHSCNLKTSGHFLTRLLSKLSILEEAVGDGGSGDAGDEGHGDDDLAAGSSSRGSGRSILSGSSRGTGSDHDVGQQLAVPVKQQQQRQQLLQQQRAIAHEELDEDFDVPDTVVQTRSRNSSLAVSALKGLRNLFIGKPKTSPLHPALELSVEYVIVTTKESIGCYSKPKRGSNEYLVRKHDPRFSVRERFRVYTMEK